VPVPNASITFHPGTGTSATKFNADGWWQTDVLPAGVRASRRLRTGLEALRLHYAGRLDEREYGEDDGLGERSPGRAMASYCSSGK
jgi:hypothetical protein